jgi:hypothetical protein
VKDPVTSKPKRISIKVAGKPGLRYSNEPLTFGVPFAEGDFPAGTTLRAVTADGHALPIQTAVMTTWKKDLRDVKWLLVDLQADPASVGETVWLEFEDHPGGWAESNRSNQSIPSNLPAQPNAITTTEAGGILTIDTGALRLRLRTDFSLWKHRETDSVFAGCEVRTADGWRPALRDEGLVLYMKDGRGNKYNSSGVCPAPRVIVEERGPLRVCARIDGHLRSEAGILFCPYRLRLHLYAGRADLRTFHTFVFNQDPTQVELAGIGMRILACPGDRARAAVGAEDGGAHWSDNWRSLSLLQADDLHYCVHINGAPFGQGRRFPGWASLGGTGAGVVAVIRDAWQEYPKGFSIERDALDIQIWPEDHAEPLSFLTPLREPPINFNGTRDEEEVKRLLAENPTAPLWLNGFGARTVEEFRWVETTIERHAPDRVKTYDDPGIDNGIGAAKTTEVLLRFSDGPIANEAATALAATVQEPLTAVVEPAYLCGTGALEHLLAAGDPRFKDVDAFLDDGHFEFCISDPVEYGRLYGMMRYGNLINLHGQEPRYLYQLYKDSAPEKILRYFGPYNNEAFDHILAVWCHFFRTGDPKHLRFAQLASRATADVGFVHAYPDDADRVGVMHYHSGHAWSGVLCRSHSIVGGIMADYYLTGNRRTLDVAIEAANHVVHVQNPAGILNCFYGNELNREFTGPLSVLLEAYQATWQERYGILAERSLAWLLRACRTPGRLPHSVFTVGPRGDEAVVHADGYPESHCGNHYMVYVPALRLFPSKELKDFLLAKADYWLWQHPRGGGSAATTLCLAYDITGNPDYAAFLADALAGCKPSAPAAQETEPRTFWMYTVSGFIPRLMKTVAQAMDHDPEGFAEHVRKWRERRDRLPDRELAQGSPRDVEVNLGRLSADPFKRLPIQPDPPAGGME